MPNRIIRDSCKTSPTLAALSDAAERLFWRLVTFADDAGRFHADARTVAGGCCPLLPHASATAVAAWLEELRAVGLVRFYSVEDRDYGLFITWEKYQRLRSTVSKYPDPPQIVETKGRGHLRQSAAIRGYLPQPAARNGIGDGNGNEEGNEDQNPAQKTRWVPPPSLPGFCEFWEAHPHKVEGREAEKVWRLMKLERIATEIIAALKDQLTWPRYLDDSIQYLKRPTSYLRKRRWEDMPPAKPQETPRTWEYKHAPGGHVMRDELGEPIRISLIDGKPLSQGQE